MTLDADDTVWRLPKSSPSSSGGWDTRTFHPRSYHADKSCQYVAGRPELRMTTKAEAQRRGLDPCGRCCGDGPVTGEPEPIECPKCGADTEALPQHLRRDCPENGA